MKILRVVALLLVMATAAWSQTPRYKNYSAPFPQLGGDGAEPSLGINWSTGNVMFQGGLETIRITFDDATSPAKTNWTLKSSLLTSLFSLDPVLFTDKKTNRTFVSQLDAGCSLTEYSDDDGNNWKLSVGCGIPAGLDHQSVGGGPYALLPPVIHSAYPNSVFYCSQNLVAAICSRSDDGGFVFGLGIPVYLVTKCGGRHGRVKIAPDGTVYLPNSSCTGGQGVAVSENNGLTWTVRTIPGSISGGSDPSVGIGSGNTVYFGYQNGDGHAKIAVSKDRGKTWISNTDVGSKLGVVNIVFPAVIAGDDNRAAFAFLGTTSSGNIGSDNFTGVWHLYISSTFDGGTTWTTVDTTPSDPVQFGPIDIQDGLEPSGRRFTTNMSTALLDRGDRNLLDFIDLGADKQGRIMVAYADGCIESCVQNQNKNLSRSALASIMRQSGGKRLFSAYDPVEPAKPGAPLLGGFRNTSTVKLNWPEPDNGGEAITGYKIYRRLSGQTLTLYKTLGVVNNFTDSNLASVAYYYAISAVNRKGESPKSNEIGF